MTQSIEIVSVNDTLTTISRYRLREMLDGKRLGLNAVLAAAGPAIIASVAYIDPGNFATNIQAGAKYGYGLLWVIGLANVMAIFFQALSAKLGIVTDQSLPELCRNHFPRHVVWPMWIGSEIAAIATDLAEFLGSAIGLALLFHIPLLVGMFITAVTTFGILHLNRKGFRPVELVITALVFIIGLCYLAEMFIIPVNWPSAAQHFLLPYIPDSEALTLSVGIIGATVMPHAIYLHSGLTKNRAPVHNDEDRQLLLKCSNWEVIVALAIAGLLNVSMVFLASAAFQNSHQDVSRIENAYHLLTPTLGPLVALLFVISLIVSGISSSAVGTMAGDMIMQGFVNFHIPAWLRRAITMLPAFIIAAIGLDVTRSLVISQVFLSLTLPIPLIALAIFTSRSDIMGKFVNNRLTTCLVVVCTVSILALNMVLLGSTLNLPFLLNMIH